MPWSSLRPRGSRAAVGAVRPAVRVLVAGLLLASVGLATCPGLGQSTVPATSVLPPRVAQSQRFLRERGGVVGVHGSAIKKFSAAAAQLAPTAVPAVAVWEPLGPTAVQTADFGLVTGRIAALAVDPADATGNTVYAGTTGGGLWVSNNAAATAGDVVFRPVTDPMGTLLNGIQATSITIGAISVQPGGTGVILAGTGDVNDALDSYYGIGVLRSTDSGTTWSLIPSTSNGVFHFFGEGFAGFAWSTTAPQTVVAAVAQAYGGLLEGATMPGASYQGLYYSTDAGATWQVATIMDQNGQKLQDGSTGFTSPDGNATTSVVWNPVRHVFVAAVRYHGYYQSTDGATWTRLTAQPGTGLTVALCPTNAGTEGSVACPIYRGTLAVNPLTGDTFAWTVDAANQDQGIWQDACAISAGACGNQTIAFAAHINTAALEVNQPLQGAATIMNGDYNLALAAVPSGQDTLLMAGANDVWKCSLAAGCTWRNTTNSTTCRSAGVGEYQHAIAWNTANPLEVFVGNDSGLWRSTDAIGETGAVCSAGDAAHFDNLNGGLGSLSETASLADVVASPYTLLAGLGVNGAAGVKKTTGTAKNWPQVLDGEGGPVAIDPSNASKWYVNNQAGVSIHLCAQTGDCTAADFGTTAVVTDADVGGDGYTMVFPAPFMVDPLDRSQLLVGTCRVWRGPTDGSSWSSANALSGFLDNVAGSSYCNGNALIHTLAAAAVQGGGEVIYVGMSGSLDGGGLLAGHVLRAAYTPGGAAPVWQDLALNPVSNDDQGFNINGADISSIYVDPHDATGNTVYVTVQGVRTLGSKVRILYVSTDGGAHWAFASLGLPSTAANSVVVDPIDTGTVYLATDAGVFATSQISNCLQASSSCWAAYGAGLPPAPVTVLHAAPAAMTPSVLVAGTYGRGVWQIPLLSAGTQLTTATIDPVSLDFGSEAYGTPSSSQTVTVTNTGGIGLAISSITITGDFTETDNCQAKLVNAGMSCTIDVTFTPSQQGARTGQMTVNANIAAAKLTVALSGTGGAPGAVSLQPTQLSFGTVQVGTTSNSLYVTVQNLQTGATAIGNVSVTAPFVLAGNACGSSLAGNSSCAISVAFAPTQPGATTGTLTVTDSTGTQKASLSGTGAAAPTDTLSPTSLTFPGTVIGQISTTQTVTLTNAGGVPLTLIAPSITGPFTVSSTCAGQLAGNASCAFQVGFAPTASGAASGKLTVSDTLRTQTVQLTGSGLEPPVIGVSPTSLTFAAQQVGVASAPLTLTLTNTGGAAMAKPSFAWTGAAATSFSTGTTTCAATLSAGASCTVQAIFKPVGAGASVAMLTLSSPTPGVQAVTVPVSGTATASNGINVSPAQMLFTVATLGQASAAQTATISNTSAVAATGITIATAAPFSLTANTCGASLAAGASCSVGVVFTPTANGSFAGALTLGSANLNGATVQLSGAGGAAGSVALTPGSLAFPITALGTTSAAQTMTVTNISLVPLTNLVLSVSGGFAIQSTTCSTTLAMGASCAVSIAFAPTAAGVQSGSLTVASPALPASVQAGLSGAGFDFGIGTGSASQTVASGQTASFSITLTPLGGTAATFSYSCGALPSHSSCSFSPPSVFIAANNSGSVLLNVSTGKATAAAQPKAAGWGRPLALSGLLLLPLAWKRRKRALLLAALLALLAGGATGCVASGGGSSGGGGSGSTTPAGTYTITVTATANGVSHTANLTLTVD